MTVKEVALSGLGTIIGNFLPKLDLKMGDWSFSLNAVILLGKSNGLGLDLQISYTEGDWNFSYGFGITGYGKYLNTGKSGTQYRNSFMPGYDDGTFCMSLATNFGQEKEE